MPVVPAVCPNCGAPLKLDNDKRAALCPYCQTPFVVEDAINNYITYQTTNIGQLHADHVTIENNKMKQLLDAGHAQIQLGSKNKNYYEADRNYNEAAAKFREATETYPGRWEGWWGLIEAEMAALSHPMYHEWPQHVPGIRLEGIPYIQNIKGYYRNVETLTNGNVPANIAAAYQKFVDALEDLNLNLYQLKEGKLPDPEDDAVEAINKEINAIDDQIYALDRENKEFRNDLNQKGVNASARNNRRESVVMVLPAIICAIAVFLIFDISILLIRVICAVVAFLIAINTISPLLFGLYFWISDPIQKKGEKERNHQINQHIGETSAKQSALYKKRDELRKKASDIAAERRSKRIEECYDAFRGRFRYSL